MGITFAVSSKDYKEKDSQLNSTSTETTKFVCNAATISASSLATKDYNENLEKWTELRSTIASLDGDTIAFLDPCE